jgi:acyl dehydratase
LSADDGAVQVGASTTFTKTVSEADVYLYAGITGDFSPNHVDEVYMRAGRYGRRIAHGTLLMGFMSAAWATTGSASRRRCTSATRSRPSTGSARSIPKSGASMQT